jgi:anthranilate/para-aminobenzoate synthase component I
MFLKDGTCHAQAAAGIVFDSVPELEYLETENKLGATHYVVSTTKARRPHDSSYR